ncbi:MAG: glycosyltransferase [Lachnospiraceae bacterium]|nr:glycosyltransferase [Lachnospiraceae bacterium]
MTISVCMIVRDEEAILERALDSLTCIADEIIIVDTGSVDRTKYIAAKYTDKIYDFAWKDDFAAARNFAFSFATMDYIYSADADEVIDEENQKAFKILKEALMPEIEIVQMLYTNQLQFNTTYNFDEELRPKLFKRVRSFTWVDPLHETVRTLPVVFDSDVKIKHMPTAPHDQRDFSMYQRILAREGSLSPKLQSMYARELFITGGDEDFLAAADFFISKMYSDEDIELTALNSCVVAKCARLKDDAPLMLKAQARALSLNETPSEAVFELGEYYREKRDYKESVKWYYKAAFETESCLNHKYHDEYPLLGLHICYVIMGDRENAAKYADCQRSRS